MQVSNWNPFYVFKLQSLLQSFVLIFLDLTFFEDVFLQKLFLFIELRVSQYVKGQHAFVIL